MKRTALLSITALLFAVFFLWPLGESLKGSLLDPHGRLTFAYYTALFSSPIYREGFVNAVLVAVASTAAAALVGIPIAFIMDRYEFPGRRILSVLLPAPLILPPFVGAIGVRQILGQNGALNALLIKVHAMSPDGAIDWLRAGRFWAVVALTALHLYPILYFNVAAALANLHPEIEQAAENLGATGARKLRRVTLPLVLPSVFASSAIVFIWGLTELGVPLMCDYTRITSVQIYAGLKDIGQNPFVHALVAVVLVATVGLYAAARLALGRAPAPSLTKGVARRAPVRRTWCTFVLAAIVLLAALPNASVVLVSLTRDWYGTVLPTSFTLAHYRGALGHPMVVPSIANSLRYVTLATLLDLVLGVAIAHVVVRGRSAVARVLDALAMLPLAVPGLVLAFGYLALSHEGGPLDFLGPARDPTLLLVIAYGMRRLPFIVRSTAAGLEQIGTTLEDAAASLGAPPRRAWLRVTLPLLSAHLLAGGVFVFALSMLEVSDSLILAQKQSTFPITKAMFELFQLLGDGRFYAAALGVWAMLLLATCIAVARNALGRRFGGMFRV